MFQSLTESGLSTSNQSSAGLATVHGGSSNMPDYLSDPGVALEIGRMWLDSNPHATEVHGSIEVDGSPQVSLKQEHGLWVTQDPISGEYGTVRILSQGIRDGITWFAVDRPLNAVAAIHTHPNTSKEGFWPYPSQGDTTPRGDAFFRVPRFIRTHIGIIPSFARSHIGYNPVYQPH